MLLQNYETPPQDLIDYWKYQADNCTDRNKDWFQHIHEKKFLLYTVIRDGDNIVAFSGIQEEGFPSYTCRIGTRSFIDPKYRNYTSSLEQNKETPIFMMLKAQYQWIVENTEKENCFASMEFNKTAALKSSAKKFSKYNIAAVSVLKDRYKMFDDESNPSCFQSVMFFKISSERFDLKKQPIMLITGSSRGIGEAIYNHFKYKYNVIGVSRTGNPERKGDITDPAFRELLLNEINPDVFINNAGILDPDFSTVMETNLMAAGHLMTEYYKRMKPGSSIINMASSCAVVHGYPNMTNWRLSYHTAKSALKKLSENLSESRTRNVRVTSLEPAHVDTLMTCGGRGELWNFPEEEYQNANIDKFLPMPPKYIAETIEWILQQPKWVQISNMRILNLHNKELADMPVDTR